MALASCGDRVEPEPDVTGEIDLGALRTSELALTNTGETCVEPWGLVGHWTLDAIHSGVVQDSSPHFRHGTATISGNDEVTEDPSGARDGALAFGGTGTLTLPQAGPWEGADPTAIAVWVRRDESVDRRVLASRFDSAGKGYVMGLEPGGHVFFAVAADASTGDYTLMRSVAPVPADTWTHVAVHWTGMLGHDPGFWLGGERSSTAWVEGTLTTLPTNVDVPLTVGGGAAGLGMNGFVGSLDDLVVYDEHMMPLALAGLMDGTTAANPRNCGACGVRCGPDSMCVSGVCELRVCGDDVFASWELRGAGDTVVAADPASGLHAVGIDGWMDGVDGEPNGAALFDATAGACAEPMVSPDPSQAMTVAAWVKRRVARCVEREAIPRFDVCISECLA